jgi:hypothetical protein
MVVADLRSGVILIGAFLATAVFTGCGGKASLSGGRTTVSTVPVPLGSST